MNHIFLVVSLLSAVHAYSFGRWLKRNGNTKGALAVFLLIGISFAVQVYKYIRAE